MRRRTRNDLFRVGEVIFYTLLKLSWYKKYLAIYARKSYPNEGTKSLTFFDYSHSKDSKFSGVVDKCFREGRTVSEKTDSIADIELAPTFEENRNNKKRIKTYMNDTHIDISNYDKLYNMSRRANELFAVPITTEDERIWGVLVVDRLSDGRDQSPSLQSQLEDRIE